MDLVFRLLVALLVITAPTALFLGLMRGLEKLRDDALLMRLAESDDTPRAVSATAARALGDRPTHPTGQTDDNSLACSTCGESNMLGARYCQECLKQLD